MFDAQAPSTLCPDGFSGGAFALAIESAAVGQHALASPALPKGLPAASIASRATSLVGRGEQGVSPDRLIVAVQPHSFDGSFCPCRSTAFSAHARRVSLPLGLDGEASSQKFDLRAFPTAAF